MTAHIAQAKRHEALGRLADRRLHRELAYVDGHWTASASGESFEVTDPASGASLAWVASLDADLSASLLGPGRSAAVNTGVTVTQTGLFVIEVDPVNEVEESSEFNNSKRVLLVGTES